MSVKKFLADLYDINDMDEIIKKIQFYKEFLEVIGKVDAGYPTVTTYLYLEANYQLTATLNLFPINLKLFVPVVY